MAVVGARSVMLAAGGTGGHLFPAFALAQELARRAIPVDLVTDMRGDRYGGDFPARAVYRGATGGGKTREMLKVLPGDDEHPLTFEEIGQRALVDDQSAIHVAFADSKLRVEQDSALSRRRGKADHDRFA